MAYSDIQQTEFNRATENLIEITWTYVNLQKEFPKLSETDSMGWKQMFVVWANEFEENFGRTDWDESEKTYQEAIEEFAKEKIFQWVGIRKYICIGRHIEGITLNPYEWLMEKGRKVKLFENEVEAEDTCIRIRSEMNEWMDCIFIVSEEDAARAEKVLQEAWDSYWEDGDGWCYGNYLEDKLIKAGIAFDSYYADSED